MSKQASNRKWAQRWLNAAQTRGVEGLRKQTVTLPTGKESQTFSGRAIAKVMSAYASYGFTGDIHPSQKALAEKAGVSERTVELVQDWLIQTGWVAVVRSAVPGHRGLTVRLTIPPKPYRMVQRYDVVAGWVPVRLWRSLRSPI